MALVTGDQLLKKARRCLAASRRAVETMLDADHSDLDRMEDELFTSLTNIDVATEALLEASKLIDAGRTRQKINSDRGADPLLHYVWKARVAEHHSSGLLFYRLDFQFSELKIIDAEKFASATRGAASFQDAALRGFLLAMGKNGGIRRYVRTLKQGIRPQPDIAEAHGFQITANRQELALREFVYKNMQGKEIVVGAPNRHLDRSHPNSAGLCVIAAVDYYEARLAELESELSKP